MAAPRDETAGEPISIDPSGFGVVEVGSAEERRFEPTEQDHETKARRQDERDEEQERAREERAVGSPRRTTTTKTSMTTRRITSNISAATRWRKFPTAPPARAGSIKFRK